MLPVFRYAEFKELAIKRMKEGLIILPFARVHGYCFWLLCVALLLALHAEHGLDNDEGVVLNGAWNLLNGRTLYTDFFEFVAPGSFYLIFAIWKLFGAHFWIAKLLGIFAILGGIAGVYYTSRLILSQEHTNAPRWVMFFGPLVYCLMSAYWPVINHNTFNIALVIWGAYFITKSILRQSFPDAFIGGLISGMAVLFLQHRGLVLAADALFVFGVLYVRDKEITWLNNCAGFLMGALIPLGMILPLWPSSLLVENLIHFPATRYLEVNRVDLTLFLITACSLVLATWLLRNCSIRAVWFLISLQVALFVTTLQRPDLCHVTLTLFPVLSLFPFLHTTTSKASPLSKSKLFLSCITCVLIGLVILPIYTLLLRSWFVDKSETFSAFQYVSKNCASSPYIYAGPFLPGYYFETKKLNPTRYSVLLTNFHTSSQFLEAKKDLETHRPPCVIRNYAMAEEFNYNKDNVVDRYIAENYELALQDGRIQVFVAHNP